MFCSECGAQNEDDARFCGECGTSMAGAGGNAEPAREEAPGFIDPGASQSTAAGTISDGLKYGILGASVLMPLIGIIMGLVYLLKADSDESKSVGKLWLFGGLALAVLWAFVSGGY